MHRAVSRYRCIKICNYSAPRFPAVLSRKWSCCCFFFHVLWGWERKVSLVKKKKTNEKARSSVYVKWREWWWWKTKWKKNNSFSSEMKKWRILFLQEFNNLQRNWISSGYLSSAREYNLVFRCLSLPFVTIFWWLMWKMLVFCVCVFFLTVRSPKFFAMKVEGQWNH